MGTRNKKGEPPKTRNVTIDADLVEVINQRADELKPLLGFRPTLSQTIRYTFRKGNNNG